MRTFYDRVVVGLEVLVYVVVFWYMYDEVQEMRIQGYAAYFGEGWHWVDWANLLMFVLVLCFKAVNYLRFGSIFEKGVSKAQEDIVNEIDVLGNSLLLQDQVNGFNGFVLWLKLFRYISITRRIQRLAHVTVVIIYDVASFCVLFFVVAYAFVIFGHLLFKSKVPGGIRRILATHRSCHQLLTGQISPHASSTLVEEVTRWMPLHPKNTLLCHATVPPLPPPLSKLLKT